MSGSIDQGIGVVTSGQAYSTGALSASRTYTLTSTNAAGQSATSQVTVNVVAATIINSFVGATTVTAGTSTTLSWNVSNATSVNISPTVGGVMASGSTSVTPSASQTYTLTATNAAGDSTTSSQTVTVVPAPIISSFTGQKTITAGLSTTLSWVASNGTSYSISPTVGSVAASGTTGALSPGASQTYTLTVTNAAGTSVTATQTIYVVAAPSITSFTASNTNPLYGASVTITPTFSNGSGSITGVGAVASGTAYGTGAVTSTLAYTLTVSNGATTPATTTAGVSITPQTVSVSAISPAAPTKSVNTQTTFSSSVSGAINSTINWTCTGGSITSGGIWTAPATPGNYTITATSAADGSKFTSTAVNLVALPIATSLVPATSNPLYGATVDITATFSDGSAIVDNGVGGIGSSPKAFTTSAITSAQTYTLTVTNLAGATATTSTTVIPQTVSVSAISPAAPTKSINTQTTFSSSVSGALNSTINWTCTGGSITAGGVWTAPATPGNYTITATSAADATKVATTSVTLVALPTISNFVTALANITTGDSTTITPTFTGTSARIGTTGSGSSDINPSVSSGTGVLVTPNSNKTYTLTVYNTAGDFTTASVGVNVYAVPTISLVLTEASGTSNDGIITEGASVTLTPTFTGGTATLGTTGSGSSNTSASCTSGVGVVSTLGSSQTYTATVTNPAGRVVTATASVISYAAPSISSFTVASNPIDRGAIGTLSYVFANGVGVINNGIGSVASGLTSDTPALTVGTTYTLTVTNPAGTSAQATATVNVNAVAVSLASPGSPGNQTTSRYRATSYAVPHTGGSLLGTPGNLIDANPSSYTTGTANPAGLYGMQIYNFPSISDITSLSIPSIAFAGGSGALSTSCWISLDNGASWISSPTLVPNGAGLTLTPAQVQTLGNLSNLRLSIQFNISANGFFWVSDFPVDVTYLNAASITKSVGSQVQYYATVTGAVNTAVTWTCSGGSITSSGLYTAPATIGTYTVTATSQSDNTKSRTHTVTTVAMPTASLTASSNPVPYGSAAFLTPTFTNGVGVLSGFGTVTSGQANLSTGAMVGTPKSYTLTVTNAAGDSAIASITITNTEVTLTPITVSNAITTVGTIEQFYATAAGAAFNLITWTASGPGGGGSWTGSSWTSPGTPGTYTITATAQADGVTSRSFTETVVAAATANLVADTTNPLVGATVALTPTFTGGTAILGTSAGSNNVSASAISGQEILVSSAANTYTLRVTNAASDFVDSSVLVAPQIVVVNTPSQELGFTYQTINTSRAYTAEVTGAVDTSVAWSTTGSGIGIWDSNYWTSEATGAFTITATSVVDPAKSNSRVIQVLAAPSLSIEGDSSVLHGGTVAITPTFSVDGGAASVSLDHGIGFVTNGQAIQVTPSEDITYTLTITNLAGDTFTVSKLITVDIPKSGKKSAAAS